MLLLVVAVSTLQLALLLKNTYLKVGSSPLLQEKEMHAMELMGSCTMRMVVVGSGKVKRCAGALVDGEQEPILSKDLWYP